MLALCAWADVPSPVQVMKSFIGYIDKRNYKEAYRLFSKPLRQKIDYGDFHDGAIQVSDARVVSMKLIHESAGVAKARVTLTDLEKYHDQTKWHRERYAGEVVLLREKAGWRFIQVLLQYPRKRKHRN